MNNKEKLNKACKDFILEFGNNLEKFTKEVDEIRKDFDKNRVINIPAFAFGGHPHPEIIIDKNGIKKALEILKNLKQMKTKNTGLTPKIREEKAEENFIYTDEITDCHQVYMIDMPAGNPVNTYVLTRKMYDEGLYYFLCLNSKTSNGNTYCPRYKTIKEAVEEVLRLGYKIFIDHELNHKDALQRLIDNGK